MKLFADLHIHSRFSRATSRELDIPNLEKYGRIKGLGLIGTGDFTHPEWLQELKRVLHEDGSGILKTASGFNFVLSAEISNIYSQGGKVRKIHNVLLAPDFETVEQVNEYLEKLGNIKSDGRPIFGKITCEELVEELKGISEEIEIIPAHVWTPWFSLFGSMSGFDSVEECFGDQSRHIYALETGLSSDPPMNWRLSQLDRYTLVSNSDSHSFWPWRIGRECNVLDIDLNYKNLINAIRTTKGFVETLEVDPSYGKYHFDGHRDCSVCMDPTDAKKHGDKCPKCGRKLTIGVLHRVEELADRPEGYVPKDKPGYRHIMPLSELIALSVGVQQLYSKKVFGAYQELTGKFGSEFEVLLNVPEEELKKAVDEKLAVLIMRNREGKIDVKPGYDGVYGVPQLEEKRGQKRLSEYSTAT
jgi:uncharacterized protein (TIGR00375 family)